MSSRSETSVSALERLRADVERVSQTLAAGRAALPRLAMGTDSEGLVHVGMDQRGDVVRLDLDPSWRDTLRSDKLGEAVSEALQEAAQVRTGDWAAAIAASYPGPQSTPRNVTAPRADPPVRATGHVSIARDTHGAVVTIAPGWTAKVDDDTVRQALLSALTLSPGSAAPPSARPAEVRDLARSARDSLLDVAAGLPGFMRPPIHGLLERVHDGVSEALALPLAGESLAAGELETYAARLQQCLQLVDRPAGLPEAAEAWVISAADLTSGLAATRRAPRSMLSRLRRRASA